MKQWNKAQNDVQINSLFIVLLHALSAQLSLYVYIGWLFEGLKILYCIYSIYSIRNGVWFFPLLPSLPIKDSLRVRIKGVLAGELREISCHKTLYCLTKNFDGMHNGDGLVVIGFQLADILAAVLPLDVLDL